MRTLEQALNLSSRQLSSIPEEVFTRDKLEKLWLDDNQINDMS
jgi:Leucine-rich repeat (LRR) protein